jgi:hypothetical protein
MVVANRRRAIEQSRAPSWQLEIEGSLMRVNLSDAGVTLLARANAMPA